MAWRHHFLVLLQLSRCTPVKFETSEKKPRRQWGWRPAAFVPFTTADSSTHFRLNQFSGLRRPKTIPPLSFSTSPETKQIREKCCLWLWPLCQSSLASSLTNQWRPDTWIQSFVWHKLPNWKVHGRSLVGICANCCLKVGSDAMGMISACAETQSGSGKLAQSTWMLRKNNIGQMTAWQSGTIWIFFCLFFCY